MLKKFKNSNFVFYLLGVSIYCLGLVLLSNGFGIYVSVFGLFSILFSIIRLIKENPDPSEIINRITYLVIFIILLIAIQYFIAKVNESVFSAGTG